MTGMHIGDDGKHLLTGATGFLGSHIMAGLLLKGEGVVILGRPADGVSLKARIRRLLAWFGISHLEGLLEFHEIDFLKVRLGLGEDKYRHLCSRRLSIIHCASDTSFAEKNRARVMKSNVENLTEILHFARESRTRCFHLISTAYAAGTDHSECPEAPSTSAHFTNAYEESKARAENMVAKRCEEDKLSYTIIRPSIIYGDSMTGKSLRFNSFYYPVRSLQYIREIYLNDLRHNGGKKSGECDIYVRDDGSLHLPIRIFIPNDGNLNLIPVDYFTQTMLAILERPVPGTFYHITGDNPVSTATLALYTERFLRIHGIEVAVSSSDAHGCKNPPEELFEHCIKPYRPYMSDRRTFMRANTDSATHGALPPDFSYEIFRRCMAFAVSVDWGKQLFS